MSTRKGVSICREQFPVPRPTRGHLLFIIIELHEKVQVGKDQEKAQSEKDSHSKNRGGKKTN